MDIDDLRKQYAEISGRTERMRGEIYAQLLRLIDDADVTLGVPMESRVKEWPSIVDKIERKGMEVEDIQSLPDIIGIRAILLFRTDLETVDTLIHQNFDVLSSEDTSERLSEAQFGYQSLHYIIKVPASWLAVPSMADFGDLQAEIQVRTLAQHIWAAASHKLQYKEEASVPPPVRRAINRASALLETVDLEFERVLSEREEYNETGIPAGSGIETLNVDLLMSVLKQTFPAENMKDNTDPYGRLLVDLRAFSINTVNELRPILSKHYDEIMERDRTEARSRIEDGDYTGTTKERVEAGLYFSHVGLARQALALEFGEAEASKVIAASRDV